MLAQVFPMGVLRRAGVASVGAGYRSAGTLGQDDAGGCNALTAKHECSPLNQAHMPLHNGYGVRRAGTFQILPRVFAFAVRAPPKRISGVPRSVSIC